MAQCSANIKAYDFKKINSEISNIKRRVCYLESTSGGASSKFGVAGEDNTATQNRAFTLGNFKFSLLDNNGNTNLLLDPANNINFFGFDSAGDGNLLTGWNFTDTNEIQGKAAGKTLIHALESISGIEFYAGDVFLQNNGTYIFIDDANSAVSITNVPAGAITNDFATFDGTQIKKIPAPIESGTYTPSLSDLTNLNSATPEPWQYMRVGNVVTVSGTVNVEPTAAAGTITSFLFNVPINSDLQNPGELAGTLWGRENANHGGEIFEDDVNTGIAQFTAQSVNANNIYLHFTYLITVTPP